MLEEVRSRASAGHVKANHSAVRLRDDASPQRGLGQRMHLLAAGVGALLGPSIVEAR